MVEKSVVFLFLTIHPSPPGHLHSVPNVFKTVIIILLVNTLHDQSTTGIFKKIIIIIIKRSMELARFKISTNKDPVHW